MTQKSPLQDVIDGGYCTGCGGCAALDPRIRIKFDDMQRLQAILPDDGGELRAAAACPFAEGSADEDEIAAEVFTAPNLRNDNRIGRYLATFGGWVIEEDFRERASSGGIGSWIQTELLRRGLVDAILNVMAETVSPAERRCFGLPWRGPKPRCAATPKRVIIRSKCLVSSRICALIRAVMLSLAYPVLLGRSVLLLGKIRLLPSG